MMAETPFQNTFPLLQVENLTVHIDLGSISFSAVEDVSFDISFGETLALVGESGSGKTMTALALLGLLPKPAKHVGGEIRFAGKVVSEKGEMTFRRLRGKRIAMIFQEPTAALNPVFRIGTQLTDVVKTHFNLKSKAAKTRICELFARVGLRDPEVVYRAYPHQLSGGMAQRVMIALALSCDPQLIIADEPTTALDVTTQAQVLELIADLQDERRFSLLLISHDMGLVSALADTMVVMRRGVVVEKGAAGEVLTRSQHAYTRSLLAGVGITTPGGEIPTSPEVSLAAIQRVSLPAGHIGAIPSAETADYTESADAASRGSECV